MLRHMSDGELKQLLEGCFGVVDYEFGEHDLERERARELMSWICRHNISRGRIEQAATEYLKTKGCTQMHIDKQLAQMRDLSNWLDD